MLSQFTFQNYKSFKDEATLDFLAEPINEHDDKLITDKFDNEKILPIIALYGPNGGGKSTVLSALFYLKAVVVTKVVMLSMNDDISDILTSMIEQNFYNNYHKFDENCKVEPTKFDILFKIKDMEFKYTLDLIENKVIEENLYMRSLHSEDVQTLFERKENDCFLGDYFDGLSVNKIKTSMPLLSHLCINYDFDIINLVVQWFANILYLDFDFEDENKTIEVPEKNDNPEEYKIFYAMLKEMDINIIGIRLEKDSDDSIKGVFTNHELPNGKTIELSLQEESSGTKKLFTFLRRIIISLESGSLVVADELDAKLHPKLIKYIIELFTNQKSNKNGAQLLITSHDMSTMNKDVLRRDEIWFCALDENNASTLYPLVTFKKDSGAKPRNDEAYDKQYIKGRYGADPYLKTILKWGEDYEQ